MFDKILQHIAPHYCYGCHKIGKTLCSNCKHDIIHESSDMCILCSAPAGNGICANCWRKAAYSRAWHVGEREGTLRRAIDGYKFERKRLTHAILAELLHARIPHLPPNTIVVPIPTVAAHIRQRGYDHCFLLAKRFAQLRSVSVDSALLQRRSNTVQRGKTKQERQQQAKLAFKSSAKIKAEIPYLIIDDVVTTGATVQAAAQALKSEGAKDIFVAAIARQPLDD